MCAWLPPRGKAPVFHAGGLDHAPDHCAQAVEPLFVLILLPVLIGVAAETYFRDTLRASAVATVLAPTVVYFCLTTLDPGGTWNWLATLLFSPLAIALALAAVMVCFGRGQVRKRPRRNGV